MVEFLNQMYRRLGEVHDHFLPDTKNWRLVEFSGGTQNNVGEYVNQTRTETDFAAVEWSPESEETQRATAPQPQIDVVLHIKDGVLDVGDRVERISDGTPFRVEQIDDLAGSIYDIGVAAHLHEVSD